MPKVQLQPMPANQKWRLSVAEAAELCGLGRNTVTDLERRGQFPPRLPVGDGDAVGKSQYVAAEVRAWAEGRDWRALVAQRQEASRAS